MKYLLSYKLWKRWRGGREELGRVGGEEIITIINCMVKIYFQKKKKKMREDRAVIIRELYNNLS